MTQRLGKLGIWADGFRLDSFEQFHLENPMGTAILWARGIEESADRTTLQCMRSVEC